MFVFNVCATIAQSMFVCSGQNLNYLRATICIQFWMTIKIFSFCVGQNTHNNCEAVCFTSVQMRGRLCCCAIRLNDELCLQKCWIRGSWRHRAVWICPLMMAASRRGPVVQWRQRRVPNGCERRSNITNCAQWSLTLRSTRIPMPRTSSSWRRRLGCRSGFCRWEIQFIAVNSKEIMKLHLSGLVPERSRKISKPLKEELHAAGRHAGPKSNDAAVQYHPIESARNAHTKQFKRIARIARLGRDAQHDVRRTLLKVAYNGIAERKELRAGSWVATACIRQCHYADGTLL